MASDDENPEVVAERLEAALERIAQAASRTDAHAEPADNKEIAARLEGLIDRLRSALGTKAG